MERGHIPYGYRIENGVAMVDEEEANKIRNLYAGYLSGLGYSQAAKQAGLQIFHGTAKRIMQNTHYLGDDFYPAIIDRETFDAAEKERLKRAESLGRIYEEKEETVKNVPSIFHINTVEKHFSDPFKQAEYIYSLIESEE